MRVWAFDCLILRNGVLKKPYVISSFFVQFVGAVDRAAGGSFFFGFSTRQHSIF
jgi:hypothetical protein